MRLAWGIVASIDTLAGDVQRLTVTLEGVDAPAPAVAFPALSGQCAVGERVLLNTTAVDLGLGTGGEHFVVARDAPGTVLDDPVSGHIMKLRYTPLQRDVTSVEEPASPHHATMASRRSLDGMPVVCCGLHSQIAPVAAAIKQSAPDAVVAYVMSDAGALPIAISRLVPRLRAAGMIQASITCGQSFGGDFEAVTVHSGLLAARHVVGADIALVSIGPGIAGTSTPFGHGGVAQGEAINAAASLGGTPIAALRCSTADPRPRHVPVSHQTITALTDVALRPCLVAVPTLPDAEHDALLSALETAGVWNIHTCRIMPAASLPDTRGVEWRTMGRGPAEDPTFFAAAAAAGTLAVEVLRA